MAHQRHPRDRLVILRGLPGSGKTTLAHGIKAEFERECPGQHGVIVSEDQFLLDQDGNYISDEACQARANRKCNELAQRAMQDGVPLLVMDSRNIQAFRIRHLAELASLACLPACV